MSEANEVTSEMIGRGIREAGFSGRAICVHCSLRSFSKIAGGADTLIDAFLDAGCTLVVPTFTYRFMLKSQPGMRPARNGIEYGSEWDCQASGASDWVYSPQMQEVSEGVGQFSAAVVKRTGRVRGVHPVCSFTALGPMAERIISAQRLDDAYGPLRLLSKLGGTCALLGVGLNRLTFLHYVEVLAGRKTLRRWANGPDGKSMMVEFGGCSEGFERLWPALAGIMRTVKVGQSLWKYGDASSIATTAAETIRQNPRVTQCGNAACERCRDAMLGGPLT